MSDALDRALTAFTADLDRQDAIFLARWRAHVAKYGPGAPRAADLPNDKTSAILTNDNVAEVEMGSSKSGNRGHAGRPGKVGGSGKGKQLSEGTVTVAADADDLLEFGVTETMLQDAYRLPGLHANTVVTREAGYDFEDFEKRNRLHVETIWHDSEGQLAGKNIVDLYGNRTSYLQWMSFDDVTFEDYPGERVPGRGRRVFQEQLAMLRKAGYTKAGLFCAVTVGRYAWAKEGVNYLKNSEGERYTAANYTGQNFGGWLAKHGVPTPKGWPEFPPKPISGDQEDFVKWYDDKAAYGREISTRFLGMTAGDLARWKHPQGYTLTGKDIAPSRDYKKPWPDDLKMDIGKAFFLDDEGHGPWDGEIDL